MLLILLSSKKAWNTVGTDQLKNNTFSLDLYTSFYCICKFQEFDDVKKKKLENFESHCVSLQECNAILEPHTLCRPRFIYGASEQGIERAWKKWW